MKVKFERQKGKRFKKQFVYLDTLDYTDEDYSYSEKYKKYMAYDDIDEGSITNLYNCKSLKSAIRMVKKSDVPKGTKFYLWHKYKGCGVIITK